MTEDEQIKNRPSCSKCGMQWEKTKPLVYIYSKMYCGNCFPKVRDAMHKILLEEAEKRA